MTYLAIIVLLLAGGLLLALAGLAALDRRADRAEWVRLAALQPADPPTFAPGMVEGLPDPARRYFTFAIRPGTPLHRVAELEMRGAFGLGAKDRPGYRAMAARQILAAPDGFVWAMRARGGLPVAGSDSARWTRFRILGLIPVARMGGTPDHARSAFGRYVAEAVFWTPAALLPGPGITWEQAGPDTARVTVTHGALSQAVDVAVDAEGRPLRVTFQRWSNANPDKRYRLQPFGGTLSDYREVSGFRLPFHIEAGNMFETPEYFPFFIAEITAIRFPRAA